MKVIRRQRPDLWSPAEQLTSLREELNRLLELPFGEWNHDRQLFNGWTPAVDIYEDKDTFTVKAELPGMKREEIEISYHDGALRISGERKFEEQSTDNEPYRSERFFGRFHRTLTVVLFWACALSTALAGWPISSGSTSSRVGKRMGASV